MPAPKELSRRDFLRGVVLIGGSAALAGCATPAPAEAGPTPLPIVPAGKIPELPFATPVSIPKRVDATPIPEAGGITNVTISGKEYQILKIESSTGGGPEAGDKALDVAYATSPFDTIHPVSEDELVAGPLAARDGSQMIAIVKWTRKIGWHVVGDEKSPLELLQPTRDQVNYRSIPVVNVEGELVAGAEKGKLSRNEEKKKIDIVAVVPGQESVEANLGVKTLRWKPFFVRGSVIDLQTAGKDQKAQSLDVTDQAVRWVADELMEEVVQETATESDKIWLSKTQEELRKIIGGANRLFKDNSMIPLKPEILAENSMGEAYIKFNAILLETPRIQELLSVPGYKGSKYEEERYNIRAYTAPILWQHPSGRYVVTRIILGMNGAEDVSFEDIDRKGLLEAKKGVVPFSEVGTTVYIRDFVANIAPNTQHIFQVTVGDSKYTGLLNAMYGREKDYSKENDAERQKRLDLRLKCVAAITQTYGVQALKMITESTENGDLQSLPIVGALARLTVNTA